MIMARNEDGTYSQVGFVKDNASIDTEYIYDKDGDIVFEKGFTRETSSTVPLTINGIGKYLKAWSITGNTVQNGTPTPDTPQEVKAVGDRTSNLLNFEDLIAAPSGEMSSKDFLFPHLLILYLKPNTTYTCASSGTGSTTSPPADLNRSLYFCSTSEHNSVNVNNPVTYTTDSTGRVFIGFIDYRTNAQQYLNKTAYIWLNEGSTALPYEPYGYKIPVVTRGKNLIDVANLTGKTNALFTDNINPKLAQVKFDEATQYTISMKFEIDTSIGWRKITFTYTDGTTSVSPWIVKSDVFKYTSTSGKTIAKVEFTNYNYYGDVYVEYIQLEAGTTATPYEPYHEPITTPIYLPTPLYSGEVMRSDGSREVKWGKIVLTGEEKIVAAGASGTSYRYDFTNIKTISQIGYARKNSKITHFKQCDMPAKDVVGYDWHGVSFHLMIMTTQSTINKFKDWLKSQYTAGTPVTIWYTLETPTTETFTAPQIPTLNGTTVIDVDTAVKPTEMYTKYKSSK